MVSPRSQMMGAAADRFTHRCRKDTLAAPALPGGLADAQANYGQLLLVEVNGVRLGLLPNGIVHEEMFCRRAKGAPGSAATSAGRSARSWYYARPHPISAARPAQAGR